jgi:outer membrane autotransporter protein
MKKISIQLTYCSFFISGLSPITSFADTVYSNYSLFSAANTNPVYQLELRAPPGSATNQNFSSGSVVIGASSYSGPVLNLWNDGAFGTNIYYLSSSPNIGNPLLVSLSNGYKAVNFNLGAFSAPPGGNLYVKVNNGSYTLVNLSTPTTGTGSQYGGLLSSQTFIGLTSSSNITSISIYDPSGQELDILYPSGGGLIGSPPSISSFYRPNTIAFLKNYAANAAGVLDNLYATPGALSGVITALDNLSGAAQANAITQTLPVITGAASQATTSSMQALNQVIQGRSNSLRGMASGDEYIGNRDMWMKGFGSWANQADVNGVSGYKINTGGLAIGVDQGFTPKLNIGAVLALSNSGVSSNSNSAPSGVTINSYQAGVYGDYAIEKNIIANAQADIGMNQNKEYRNITFMGTNANGNYNSYSAHLGTGVKYLMPIDMENTFIPSVRVDYTTVQSQAYSESGAGVLNLSVAKQTYNTLIPSADVRIDHSLDSKMTLSANAGAGYNTLNNQVSATSAYAGGGTTFATNGLQVSPWLYNAGVGVTGQIDKNLQLNVRYDNVFSPTGYMNQMVSAKLKIPL